VRNLQLAFQLFDGPLILRNRHEHSFLPETDIFPRRLLMIIEGFEKEADVGLTSIFLTSAQN
jgi:hypothetical protein